MQAFSFLFCIPTHVVTLFTLEESVVRDGVNSFRNDSDFDRIDSDISPTCQANNRTVDVSDEHVQPSISEDFPKLNQNHFNQDDDTVFSELSSTSFLEDKTQTKITRKRNDTKHRK